MRERITYCLQHLVLSLVQFGHTFNEPHKRTPSILNEPVLVDHS